MLTGEQCLYEFKVNNCNPMNSTEECRRLAECFQTADNVDEGMSLALEFLQKTTRSLSETVVGPVAIILLFILMNNLRG